MFTVLSAVSISPTAGYSVLGWNHPGFSGSTGRPYPDQVTFLTGIIFHQMLWPFSGVGCSGCRDAICYSQTWLSPWEHSCIWMVHRYKICLQLLSFYDTYDFPGGFTSSWLAMNYPDIRGLILDATFDHLEPLAIPRMPAAMSPLVSRAVNKFINLNVAEQVVIF